MPRKIQCRSSGEHVVAAVVAHHDQQRIVLAEAYLVGDFEGEGRGPAAVCADMIAVHEEVGDVLHAVELHEQPFRCPFGGYVHVVLIIGCRFEEITAGSRVGIPCVGQGYVPGVVAAVLRLEEETPSFVERKYLAGLHRSAGGKEQECCYVSFHGSRIYYASACKDNTTSVQNQIFEMHAAGCRRARSRCRTGADSRITAVCGPPRRIAGRISKRRLAGQTARPDGGVRAGGRSVPERRKNIAEIPDKKKRQTAPLRSAASRNVT